MAAINEAHLRKTAESLLGEDATLKEALADGTLTNRMLREHLAKATGINAVLLKPHSAMLKELASNAFSVANSPPEEEGEGEEGEALLRGKLTIDEKGEATWRGHWSFNKADWARGEKSKFVFTSKEKLEAATLGDGEWVAFGGNFVFGKGDLARKEKEHSVKFRWSKREDEKTLRFEGRGKNSFGNWSLHAGLYERCSGKLSARRLYGPGKGSGPSKPKKEASLTAALLGAPMEEEEDDEDFDASKVEAPDSSGGESEADDSEGDFDEDAPADGAVKKTKKKKKVKKKRDEGALALRGELRCDAEVWRWSGVWATSEAALLEGVENPPNSFELHGPAAAGAASPPPKLEMSGSFVFEQRDVAEPRVVLTFAGEEGDERRCVVGSGSNDFGDFELVGTYVAASRALEVSKKYAAPVEDDEDEDMEEGQDPEALATELAELRAEASEMASAGSGRRVGDKSRRSGSAAEHLAAEKRRRTGEDPSSNDTRHAFVRF